MMQRTLPAGWALVSPTRPLDYMHDLTYDDQWRAQILDGGNTRDTLWALTTRPDISDAHLAAEAYGQTALDAALNWLAATA